MPASGLGELGMVITYRHQFHSSNTSKYFDASKTISAWNQLPIMLRAYIGGAGRKEYDTPAYNNYYLSRSGTTGNYNIFLICNCELCHPINPITGAPASGITTDWGEHITGSAHSAPEIMKRFRLYVGSSAAWYIYELQIWGSGSFMIGASNNIQQIAIGEIIGFDEDFPPNERDLAHPPAEHPQIITYGNQNSQGEYIHQASAEVIDPAYPNNLLTVIINGTTYEVVLITAAQIGSGQTVKFQGESLLKLGTSYYTYTIDINGNITLAAFTSATSSNTAPATRPFQFNQIRVWRKNDVTGVYELWDAYGVWDLTLDPNGRLVYWKDIYDDLVVNKGPNGPHGPFEYFYPGEYKIEGWFQNALTQPYTRLPGGGVNPAAPEYLVINKEFVVIYVEPEIEIDGIISCNPDDFPVPEHVFKNFADVTFAEENNVIKSVDIYFTAKGGSVEILLDHIEEADLMPVYGVKTFADLLLIYDIPGDYRVEMNYIYYTATPVNPEVPGPNPRLKTDIFRIIDFIDPSFIITGCSHRFGEEEIDQFFAPSVIITIADPKNIATSFQYTIKPPLEPPQPSTPIVPPPPLDGHSEVFSDVDCCYSLEIAYKDECGDPVIHEYDFEIIDYISPSWEIIGTLAEYQTNPDMPQYVGIVILRITDEQRNVSHVVINGTISDPPLADHVMAEIGIYTIQFLMKEPCYPVLKFIELEITPPLPLPMLQLGKNNGGTLSPKQPIAFDEIILTNNMIKYNQILNAITFLYTGIYKILWWVAPQTGLATEASNFAIITDNGHEIIGSSHSKITQTSGFAILEVGALGNDGRLVLLTNNSNHDVELSSRAKTQVGLLIFKLGRLTNLDYIHLQTLNIPKKICEIDEMILFDEKANSGFIKAITFKGETLGILHTWEPGDYHVSWRIQFIDDSTALDTAEMALVSLTEGIDLSISSTDVDPVTGEGMIEGHAIIKNVLNYNQYAVFLRACGSDDFITVKHAEIWMWQLNRNNTLIEI